MKRGPLDYVIIDNFFNENELHEVNQEVSQLITFKNKDTNSALKDDGSSKKTGEGLWVDGHYFDNNIPREHSPILKYSAKIFLEEVVRTSVQLNAYFKNIRISNQDSTLLNYYNEQQSYLPHYDNSLLTALTFLKIGDFTGGDLEFTEYNEIVPFKENRTVIFPGCVEHYAKPIKELKQNSYRVSIAKFINFREDKNDVTNTTKS